MSRSSHVGPTRLLASLLCSALIAGCSSTTLDTETDTDASVPSPASPEAEAEHAAEVPAAVEVARHAPSRVGCDAVPVFHGGAEAGSICVDDAAEEGLTVIDLSDAWTPRIFAKDANGNAPEYREKYLELASQPNADLGLHGISPQLSILAARVADAKRTECASQVDGGLLLDIVAAHEASSDAKAAAKALKRAESKDAIAAAQGTLVCEGLLKASAVTGRGGSATNTALEAFRRRHMIVGSGFDAATLHALGLGSDELAFKALLRGLRERVAEASGLVEDGSAREERALVVGRDLDLTRFAPRTKEALENGAPDLVGAATDAAARELGWTSPEATRRALSEKAAKELASRRVAVALPKAPAYHSAAMALRVEIDRGDVFKSSAARVRSGKKPEEVRPPSFVVYAKDGDREVALMRWATTIGGWKKERQEDGEISVEYKASDVGDRVWRQLIAAPAWLPPESTPETDLVREDKDGAITLKRDLIQPGYRNAFGLVMLIHHEEVRRGDKVTFADHGIRTHGSVDYRSIKNGTSHGCHRLYNQLALRLSGFLLDHRAHRTRGKMQVDFKRTLEWNEQSVELDVPSRGYLYELDPPVPVRVLEGNTGAPDPKAISSGEEPEVTESARG